MLKIGLIGAPSSGKTELAQALIKALEPKKVAVVDDYIEAIQDRSDVALSHYATYLGNMQAAIGRFEAERAASKDDPDVLITCGTLIENAVYTATLAFSTAKAFDQDAAYRAASDGRASLTMMWLGAMRVDVGDYDHLFYLPLEDTSERWNAIVDEHIPESAEALNYRYTNLPTTRDDRVAAVLQELLDAETSTPNEQPSGDSEGEGEAIGD